MRILVTALIAIYLLVAPGTVPPAAAEGGGVVISEGAPVGPAGATDEFLELRNTAGVPADISGWRLVACTAPGVAAVVAVMPSATRIGAGATRLLAGAAFRPRWTYAGAQIPDLRYGADVPPTGGWLIVDAAGVPVDGLGLSAGLDCTEGAPAASCRWAAGESTGRVAGVDSDRNAGDFVCARATPMGGSGAY